MALRFGFDAWHPYHTHAVVFPATRTQAHQQPDHIEAVGLGPPCVSLHWNAGRVADQGLKAELRQGPRYPETVLSSFVQHDRAHVRRKAPS